MGVTLREKPKGSGVWWVVVCHQGKRTTRRVGTKKLALKVAEQIRARLLLGQSFGRKDECPTLSDWFDRFRRTHLATLSKSTIDSYELSFRLHILPDLGSMRLDAIKFAHVEELAAKLLEKELSAASIRIVLAELRTSLSHAIDTGHIESNPVRRISRFSGRGQKAHSIDALTADEVQRLLTATLERKPQYYPLVLTAIHTGMRAGELVGLQWGDIDGEQKAAYVRRHVVRGRIIDLTKTRRPRRVDLSDAVMLALQGMRKTRLEKCVGKGLPLPEWVFTEKRARPLDMHNFTRRVWSELLKAAKLRHVRWHDLRHTYASLLIQGGESLAYVRDQLGHSSIRMTVDVYGHLVPGANRDAVNRLPGSAPTSQKAECGKKS